MTYTLTYSEAVEGWPSFYSFYPDWMIGMNNYFYTFKGGNLYRHNTNNTRNTFYYNWWSQVGNPSAAFTASRMDTVLNDAPLENKLFKTIDIQGDDVWTVRANSDLAQNFGYIDESWFEKKEQTYFAFIRSESGANPNTGILNRPQRSLNGIGASVSVVTTPITAIKINFSITPSLVDIGTIVSVGDYIYFGYPTPTYCGQITSIVRDYPNGDNYLIINTTIAGGTVPPTQTEFFFFMKNSEAESHGILGHYMVLEMSNGNSSKIELFTVESEVMKSYP
jgi:hypothetical protein